jgi:hypothetical protein
LAKVAVHDYNHSYSGGRDRKMFKFKFNPGKN